MWAACATESDGDVAGIVALQQYMALRRLEQSQRMLDQRGLARTVGTQHSHDVALAHGEIHIAKHIGEPRVVSKGHGIERDERLLAVRLYTYLKARRGQCLRTLKDDYRRRDTACAWV